MKCGTVRHGVADACLFDSLKKRALSKFKHGCSRESVLESATRSLREAGSWKDDVRIDVFLFEKPESTRCLRLIHGIPSPRYWLINRIQWMAAIDVIYFFSSDVSEREHFLGKTLPDFNSALMLEEWLASFTSRRFHRGLIDSLLEKAEINVSSYEKHIQHQIIWRNVALDAAEIDRFAWISGYSTINLAKAAPVWIPPRR